MSTYFKDIKVVELASVLAGPAVGMFFAELGAEVIKIENKRSGGDVTRSWKLASEDPNHPYSAYYSSVNYGKNSLFLDLSIESDYQILLDEIRGADIVISNFRDASAQKLKVDYQSLKGINSRMIYGEITGFGETARTAYDVVLQAESGFISMCGTDAAHLSKMPVALIDLLAAHQLKEGILLAMLQLTKEEHPKAKKVSVSLIDTALASLANQATNYVMADHIAQPIGTRHPNIAPYGDLFSCQDGSQITLAIGNEKQFRALCSILGLNDLCENPDYINNQQRVLHRPQLVEILQEKIANFQRNEIMDLFIANDVPAGAVRSIQEVFELDEAQALILEENKENKPLKTLKTTVFQLSE